uniref:Actin filament associated protein 1-like 2 n=2 Tax=Kryptolebias marmoratus TaxID=37003 RepID=A0A3Q3B6V6_KRYMA
MTENKDVKKKSGAGLMFSNLMNIAKRKPSAFESPEKSIETSGYLNVLVNSQWRPCWCLLKNGQLWFYQDKGKSKPSQPAVTLEGCSVSPDPSPEHLYSFRIDMDGTQLATLEAKTSADMGHWLGLLLSQTGSKTDPEDLTYDYVNAERISSIVSAAKTSLYLMQRRYSEPNTYIDATPSISQESNELYDDVASIADPEDAGENSEPNCEGNKVQEDNETQSKPTTEPTDAEQDNSSRIYLDLVPLPSFLHPTSGPKPSSPNKETSRLSPVPVEDQRDSTGPNKEVVPANRTEPDPAPAPSEPASASAGPEQKQSSTPSQAQLQPQQVKTSSQGPESSKRFSLGVPQAFSSPGVQIQKGLTAQTAANLFPNNQQFTRLKAHTIGSSSAVEVKLGKNRTEADMRRYTDERDRLEREREEVRSSLANLKKERREAKEELSACQDPKCQAALEACLKQKEEACREAERRRVEVELRLVEVKESLKKVESGPFTLGTTLDSSLQDTPTTKATTLPNLHTSSSSSPSSAAASSSSSSQPSNATTTTTDSASPVNSASALKNRPVSIMATKGKVLQKAKEWEKKSTT